MTEKGSRHLELIEKYPERCVTLSCGRVIYFPTSRFTITESYISGKPSGIVDLLIFEPGTDLGNLGDYYSQFIIAYRFENTSLKLVSDEVKEITKKD